MKRIKVFFVVFMVIAINTIFVSCASKRSKPAKTASGISGISGTDAAALSGIGAPLTLNVIENELGEKNLANIQFILSKRVLLQYKDKLPPMPNGKARDMGILRSVMINRGTKGILHPAPASFREEVSSEGTLKIIRVLFDENNLSGYLEFGAWADEPDSRFELITYSGNKVLFGMPELLSEIENLDGFSWTADEPQYTASWSGRELPYLQFQSLEEVLNGAGNAAGYPSEIEDPKKVDKKARKVQGVSVKR